MIVKNYTILTINPGSTSTKISLFRNTEEQQEKTFEHSREVLNSSQHLWDQLEFRLEVVRNFLSNYLPEDGKLHAVVGRGGLLRPVPGGTYEVNDRMLEDAREGVQGQHASNLGCAMAKTIADEYDVPAFIVDPVSTDETKPVAKISGNPHIERRSLSHALNIHFVARQFARETEKPLNDSALIIAHLGGGFSIAAVEAGKIIDVNDANNEGPFSTARSGSLPVTSLAEWIIDRNYSKKEILTELLKNSGWAGYLGTTDGKEVDRRLDEGDHDAKHITEAMAYQVAKEIAAMASVLEGRTQRIILTGGLAKFELLCDLIAHRVEWIAPVLILPGEFEMHAMAEGAHRVLTGGEPALEYE